MRIFLDTNVILDYLLKRKSYNKVRQILTAVEHGKIDAVVSFSSYCTLDYIISQDLKSQGIKNPERLRRERELLNGILDLVEIGIISKSSCRTATNDPDFTDIEDSLQYRCAQESLCEVIVTINLKDYKNVSGADLRIMSPADFVKEYLQ